MIKTLFRQRPADTVTIIFLLFLLALTFIFYGALPKAPFLISLYSILIVVQIILIKLKKSVHFMGIFHNLIFPILCVVVIFDSLEWVVQYVNPKDIDPILIKIDYLIFGGHPTLLLENIVNPLLTDVLQIAYTTYYFITVIFGIVLLRKNQMKEFNKTLFFVLFCYYLSYMGYILFPALGPRFAIDHLQTTELQGFFIAEPIQDVLNKLEGIKRDAFPSGHTAIMVTVLYLAYRFKRRLFWIFLPIIIALIFSTVYCRYHYVVDIIAGIGLTIITVLIGEWYYKWWSQQHMQEHE